MPYNHLIVFIAYISGIFPAWVMVYQGGLDEDRWQSKENARMDASTYCVFWPLLVCWIVIYHFWRAFRFAIIFLASLMQDKEDKR